MCIVDWFVIVCVSLCCCSYVVLSVCLPVTLSMWLRPRLRVQNIVCNMRCVYIYIYIYICIYIYTHTYTHECICIIIHMCIYIYIYIYQAEAEAPANFVGFR